MLLGGANSKMSVTSERLKAEFTVEYPANLFDLARWRAMEIERVFALKVKYAQQQPCFSFTAGRRVRIIHQWFHRNGRKAITPKIRFMDHPVGLAMLLCDIGTVRQSEESVVKPSMALAVDSFVVTEMDLLLNHIQTLFGAEGYLKTTRCVAEIAFNPKNSEIVWERVKHWIPPVDSMRCKFQDVIQCYGK
jgi:hypothetical protein